MRKLADVVPVSSMMANSIGQNLARSGGDAKALVAQLKQLSQQIRHKWFARGSSASTSHVVQAAAYGTGLFYKPAGQVGCAAGFRAKRSAMRLTNCPFAPLTIDQAFELQGVAVLQGWGEKRIGIILEADRA